MTFCVITQNAIGYPANEKCNFPNSTWWTSAILKIDKSQYVSCGLRYRDEIWPNDAEFNSETFGKLKYYKFTMAAIYIEDSAMKIKQQVQT